MNRNSQSKYSFAISLAAALGIVALSATPSAAIEAWYLDNSTCKMRKLAAQDGEISAREAKYLARYYVARLGFTAPRLSELTARVGAVEADGSMWRVSIRYGDSIPNKRALLFINRFSGRVAHATSATETVGGSEK